MKLITLYARNAPNPDFPQYRETRLFHDREGWRLKAIFPLRCLPGNTKRVTVNCHRYEIEWV
jgi:hypothetical protein